MSLFVTTNVIPVELVAVALLPCVDTPLPCIVFSTPVLAADAAAIDFIGAATFFKKINCHFHYWTCQFC